MAGTAMTRTAAGRCVVAAMLFGASAPAASELASDLSPFTLAGLLYLGAALVVLPTSLRDRPTAAVLRAGARPLLVAVVAGGALGPVLLMAGLARTSAASASLLLNLELAATVLLAATVFREHLGARVVAAAGIVTMSGVVLVWEPGAAVDVGGLFIVGACLCWGLDNGVTALIDQIRPEQVTFAKGAVAGTANLVIGLVLVGTGGITAPQVLGALVIGALGYGVSITWWVRGARDLGAARAQVIFASAPFIGAGVAWFVLGESLELTQLMAVPIALAGIALSFDSSHEHPHEHVPMDHEHEHTHDDGHHGHDHRDGFRGRHTHRHRHVAANHAHPHVPDLHHRHPHGGEPDRAR
jgi:drug/metabolite transporter (DMT)-like permease